MNEFINFPIDSVLSLVKGSVVFLDESSAECLHWYNGFKKLLEAGALDVRDIRHTKECLESESKCMFIISTPIRGNVGKYIQRIVKNSDFVNCIIVTTLTNEVNQFISRNKVDLFQDISQQIKIWMQNEFASVSVQYFPLFNISIVPNFFVTPNHNGLFPVLPSDVARLQGFLHSQGDKRMFNNLGDVDLGFLPHNMQSKIKMLVSSLNSMFKSMNIYEDCYAVGHFSRLVATELANLPDARSRRKMASSRASVIFMDRTLDVVAPTSHTSDSVLGAIYEILPRLKNHNNDVAIDMKWLLANGNLTGKTVFPGCFAHVGDELVQDALTMFIMKSKKECVSYLCKKLLAIIKAQDIPFDEMDCTPSLLLLKALLKTLTGNIFHEKYSGFLQCATAFLNAFTDEGNSHIEELLCSEKIMMAGLGEEKRDPFAQILQLLTDENNKQFDIVDALMFCLYIYSADNELINACLSSEEKLKEALIHILMDGKHKEDLLFLIGDLDASERQIRTRISDIFERLRGIGEARKEFQQLKLLLRKDEFGIVKYKPLVSQILELVFDNKKSELVDIEFRSHGFKDFIKTGFGFFMNVSKPRPDDHPLIFLFVIGGITWYEIRCIKETLEKFNTSHQVIIGSTRILTPSDTLEQILCSENLFIDVET